MSLFAISFPKIDPVAIALGPFVVKWYGLAYMAGLLLGWLYIRHLLTSTSLWRGGKPPFPAEKVDDLLLYMTLGVILGGRLGFVFLYEPGYYLSHPGEILAVWKGGMAFHGALVGCGVACWLFARSQGADPLSVMDLSAAAVPIGLFFGRLANFINGELYGRPTSVPWAMVFPEAVAVHDKGAQVPRHPSQLYEAALEGLALFLILRVLTHRLGALARPGMVTGTFLIGYGVFRSFCELFREPHMGHALNIGPLTAGQFYSGMMILLGFYFLSRSRGERAAA